MCVCVYSIFYFIKFKSGKTASYCGRAYLNGKTVKNKKGLTVRTVAGSWVRTVAGSWVSEGKVVVLGVDVGDEPGGSAARTLS